MNIIEIKTMRGPNYWSVRYHQLIVMKLDLEELESLPTNKIEGFYNRIKKLLPGLYKHHCSEGHEGGFFERIKSGTWMGHVIEHIALEIQCLAGMDCGFGRTRGTGPTGVYHVVFAYQAEEAGIYAAKAAVRIAQALTDNQAYDVDADVAQLRKLAAEAHPGPSTGAIIAEAKKRGIPCYTFENLPIIQLGQGIHQNRIRATISSLTSSIAVDIAGSKEETKNLLHQAAIPVPEGKMLHREEELPDAVDQLGYPLVIKPVDGNQGKGATINITNWPQAQQGFKLAKAFSEAVVIEKYVAGCDFRMLVINYKFVAAARRTPACVTGDGKSTIQELIDIANKDPRRGNGHENVLTVISVDACGMQMLKENNLSLGSVSKKGQTVYLRKTANLSTGGTATDVTDLVHPNNIATAERVARIIGLDICGIDVVAPDLESPLAENGGAIIEVNAAPGFRMHLAPAEGKARNVAAPVIDMLFPSGSMPRIPVVAITGTNGKTTTTRLLAHMARTAGYQVGYTTTDGIYIGGKLLVKGDCTGPVSTEFILKDPTVDFAVLECARGGILRSGLGFDYCDIGIVTNVSADHLGLQDIDTLEKMAKVKAVIPESVHKDGYAILNADDDLVYGMANYVKSKVAFFSLDANNERIKNHCGQGGIAAVIENGYIIIYEGSTTKVRIEKVSAIPLTFDGKAICMVQNILPVVLTAYLRNFNKKDICQALKTFIPSPEQTPGRLNVFKFRNFQLMVDYAHNPAGYQALAAFLKGIEASTKVGVITGVGDRRNEDISALGSLAAQMFDEIIIREDKDLRGRARMEIVNLIQQGITATNLGKPVKVIATENESIHYVIRHARKGSFITICSEDIDNTLAIVKQYKAEEDKYGILIGNTIDNYPESPTLDAINPATKAAPNPEFF